MLPPGEVGNYAQGYVIQDDVLLRKWVPHGERGIGDPVYQLIMPATFRERVLRVSHEESGHMGVSKTCNRILRHFFWPCVENSVADDIKTCHTCQLTGKPNQTIK